MNTTIIVTMLCCYIITTFACYLQHHLYTKTSKKTGENYKLSLFKINNTDFPIKRKEYWIATLDETVILITTLFASSYIKHTLNIEFSIYENIAWVLLIGIALFVTSKATAYGLYKRISINTKKI